MSDLPNSAFSALKTAVVAAVLAGFGCADRQAQPVTEAKAEAGGASSNAPGTSTGSSDAPVAATDGDCDEESCEPLTFKVSLVDMRTGGTIDALKGYSKIDVAWGIKVEPAKGKTSRSILLRLDGPPSNLDVARKANTVIATGAFPSTTTGSLTAAYRDVDYCKVKHDDPDECDDIKTEIDGIDKTAKVAYTIVQSTQEQAAEAAKNEQSAAQKANCVAGMFSVFTGNIGGAAGCVGMIGGGL
jgi:hypothetical protein